jgi:hypothetical protein
MKTIKLHFTCCEDTYIKEVKTNLNEIELYMKVEKIVEGFEKNDYTDWTYDVLLDELKRRGYIDFEKVYDTYYFDV